jgi:hypothetical protein
VSDTRIGPGDDTYTLARLRGHDGKNRNLPTAISGSISLNADPKEPVVLQSGYRQEAFLVETRSLSGYSGSAVFVHRQDEKGLLPHDRWPIRKRRFREPFEGHRLLGVDCGHFPLYNPVEFRKDERRPWIKSETFRSVQNSGHVIVVPAWRLYDLLHDPHLVRARKQKEDELSAVKASSMAVPDLSRGEPRRGVQQRS